MKMRSQWYSQVFAILGTKTFLLIGGAIFVFAGQLQAIDSVLDNFYIGDLKVANQGIQKKENHFKKTCFKPIFIYK